MKGCICYVMYLDVWEDLINSFKLYNHNNGNKIPCFYTNARTLRNKFAELKPYINQEKPNIIFIMETWVKICVQNNKFSQNQQRYS